MDYEEALKMDEYNRKTMAYIPTQEEAGIPQKLMDDMFHFMDDPIKSEKLQKQYDDYILRWQIKNREKLKQQVKSKAARKDLKLSSHWYNTLQQQEINNLLENSRSFCDQVIDDLRERLKNEWEVNYLEQLRVRVKTAPIILSPASSSKLSRFPNYSMGTNELHGSVYAFYKLWSHVFKSHKRAGRIVVRS